MAKTLLKELVFKKTTKAEIESGTLPDGKFYIPTDDTVAFMSDLETKQDKGNYATEEELTQGLAGKQDTLTTNQLAAVNSGITSAKVASYDAYAGEISAAKTTADKADNAAEVAQQTANLAGQEAAQALSGLADKVNIAQGTANAGKILTVGDDGNIELADGASGASGAGRNIGDIFWTTRTDSALNGAVEANGAQYNFADVNQGQNNVQALLVSGALPSVSIAKFDAKVASDGGCDSFGYGTNELIIYPVKQSDASKLFCYTNNNNWYEVERDYYDKLLNVKVYDKDTHEELVGYYVKYIPETDCFYVYNNSDENVYDVSLFPERNGEPITLPTGGEFQPTTYFKVPKKLGRVLVRSQKPTADNDYTWFNLYADGWVEQGGQTVNSTTVTLPITMADTNYVTFIAYNQTTRAESINIIYVSANTQNTTNFTIAKSSILRVWQASGYAAASEYTKDKWDYQNVQVERPMVQLFNSATDEAVAQCTEVLSDVAGLKQTTDGMIDYVVESQEPTEANGYTWYRKYKSGWVEQGGVISMGKGVTNVTLPVEMNDTNYLVSMSAGTGNPGNQYAGAYKWDRTSTTIISLTNDNTGKITFSWLVLGQSAQ